MKSWALTHTATLAAHDWPPESSAAPASPRSPRGWGRYILIIIVARRVLNRSMVEPVLDRPRVVAGIAQGVAAGVAQHVARVDDIALIEHSGRPQRPRSINCYFIGVEDAAALGADAKKFRIDPQHLFYFVAMAAQRHATEFRSFVRGSGGVAHRAR
jgi:hypothetical protein